MQAPLSLWERDGVRGYLKARSASSAVCREVQVSCAAGTATLDSIVPGNYVVELDTRAVTPQVRGTQNVTVKPGENAQVAFQ
ncbi:hypothetical protein ACN28E_40550 [Archangium lansingense]|uniref:hypothetical protein n=1 Tax=Archangium lansingense TaxID=2995310 RepID=UPI003B7D70B3